MILCHVCQRERPEDLLPCTWCGQARVLVPPKEAEPTRRTFQLQKPAAPPEPMTHPGRRVYKLHKLPSAAPEEPVPFGKRRCWNCRTVLKADQACMICDAPFDPPAPVPLPPPAPPPADPVYDDPFADRMFPGLRLRLDLGEMVRVFRQRLNTTIRTQKERFVDPLVLMAANVDPRIQRLAGALLLGLIGFTLWSTLRIDKESNLGTFDARNVGEARKVKLLFRTTTALPRVAVLGGTPVTIVESWIGEVGRRQFESIASDKVRLHPTGKYRQYIRVVTPDLKIVKQITQERGVSRVPLEALTNGVYALDLRDAFPRPSYYHVEGHQQGQDARVRVH